MFRSCSCRLLIISSSVQTEHLPVIHPLVAVREPLHSMKTVADAVTSKLLN